MTRQTTMKNGFVPIPLHDYVALHLRSNPDVKRADLVGRLEYAIDAYRSGVHCQCGAPIWIIGSAETGLKCFTCITGDAVPNYDYEIEVAENDSA